VNYCGPIDPAATDRLGQMIKQLVQGASGQQLAEVRNSDEYRKAYDSVVNSAGKIAPRNAAQFCAKTRWSVNRLLAGAAGLSLAGCWSRRQRRHRAARRR